MWPAVLSFIRPPATVTRLQRYETSSGPSSTMLTASSGLRPEYTAAGSYPSTERLPTSLPGGMPSGTVLTSPTLPRRASASIAGVAAASSGVLPPSSS